MNSRSQWDPRQEPAALSLLRERLEAALLERAKHYDREETLLVIDRTDLVLYGDELSYGEAVRRVRPPTE